MRRFKIGTACEPVVQVLFEDALQAAVLFRAYDDDDVLPFCRLSEESESETAYYNELESNIASRSEH